MANFLRVAATVATMSLLPDMAHAHTGIGGTSGVLHGLMHPISGIDHVLAMVSVGLFAAQLGGRACWLLPASFISLMAIGGFLGLRLVGFPLVEAAIAASVVALGVMIAWQKLRNVASAAIIVGFFATFHGYAHGAEMPGNVSPGGYACGFILATACLHVIGIGLGRGISRVLPLRQSLVRIASGSGIAVTGLALLTGWL
jgi:urease accessory protein